MRSSPSSNDTFCRPPKVAVCITTALAYHQKDVTQDTYSQERNTEISFPVRACGTRTGLFTDCRLLNVKDLKTNQLSLLDAGAEYRAVPFDPSNVTAAHAETLPVAN